MNRPKDIGASVRARLLDRSRSSGEDFQLVLLRYANERLLFRLSQSRHGSDFVLKGATLFALWMGNPHRATRDVDLLGYGEPTESRIRATFLEVLALDVQDDGVRFDLDGLSVGPIRGDKLYEGLRAAVRASVGGAEVRLQIDVGFGDAITPPAKMIVIPSLLDFPPAKLRGYPRETVVAEKLEAMVVLGLANSRMKDFYDIAVLARTFPFSGAILVTAIRATFARRGTSLPQSKVAAFTSEFAEDRSKNVQWKAFLRKSGISQESDLAATVQEVARFLRPPLAAAGSDGGFLERWPAGGPWGTDA